MNASGKLFFVLAQIFSLIIPYGDSARCYVCDSQRNPLCGDPFTAFGVFLVDCERAMPSPYMMRSNMCRKISSRLPDGTYHIMRDCGRQNFNQNPMIEGGERCLTSPNGDFECQCFGDSCNGAISALAQLHWISAVSATVVLVFYGLLA